MLEYENYDIKQFHITKSETNTRLVTNWGITFHI